MVRWTIEFVASGPPEELGSGLNRTVWALSSALVGRGHRVRVLYPSEPFRTAPPYQGVERVPVPVLNVRREPYGRERAIARAASELLGRDSDLVVANDEKGGALTLPRGVRAGRPTFGMCVHDIQQHHLLTMRAATQPNPTLRQRVGTWLDRRTIARLESTAFSRAGAILVATEENRQLLLRYYPVPPQKVHLVQHPVPDLPEVGSRDSCREALRVPLDVPVVAFLGHTPERQGLSLALDAFRRVRVFFPGARFLVAGCSAPTEPGVMSFGVVDEVQKSRILHASDVFLFPARYEGFGLAPREAMRAGVATVVSRHVPMEGVASPEAVRVVPEDDAGAYASDLAELLADPALRRSLGAKGREYADQFRPERMAEQFESVFSPILGG
jgi:glycosyltransferase involved in cell wall biosynthesis